MVNMRIIPNDAFQNALNKPTWQEKCGSCAGENLAPRCRQRKPGRTTANKHKPKAALHIPVSPLFIVIPPSGMQIKSSTLVHCGKYPNVSKFVFCLWCGKGQEIGPLISVDFLATGGGMDS
eukprot:4599319-Amphidinium_carterae.1